MRRLAAFALLGLALFALASPVLASTPLEAPPPRAARTPWTHSAEEYYLEGLARHDGESAKTIVNVSFGWAHYVSDNVEVGLALAGLWGPANGMLAGPSVTYNFVRFGCSGATFAYCRGNLIFGGDAALATGAVSDQAAGQVASWFGAKIYQGKTAAISLLAQMTRAVSPAPDGADGVNSLDSTAAVVRISFGVPQPTTP